MNRFILLLSFSLLCIYSSVLSQSRLSTKSKKAAELYYEADNFRVRGQYIQASQLLEEAISKDKNFHEAYFRLATIVKAQGNLDTAEKLFLKVIELNEGYNGPSFFELGELYLKQNQYNKAIEYTNKYLAYNPRNQKRVEEAKSIVANANFALENLAVQSSFKPKPLSDTVNAFAMQYFPVLSVDGSSLIFTRRLGTTMNHDEDLVITTKDDNDRWSYPESISENINSQFNEGTCTLSADGRTLIFTSCYGRNGFGSCDLYISEKNGDEWTVPENMGNVINSSAWDSQPSLSADGRTLYFISNRQHGMGGRDIWYSTKDENNNWTKPKNMGPIINTVKEEVSPFIHPNNKTLYYSTNGLPGFGGFDLFYSNKEGDHWIKPVNIGSPINNGEDQVSLFISAQGDKGYYSNEDLNSEKKGIIYEFNLAGIHKVEFKSTYIKGVITSAKTKQPLKATIELYDLNKDERISLVTSDSVNGEYLMVLTEGSKYALYVNSKGYLFSSNTFKVDSSNISQSIIKNFELNPIETGAITNLNNIFFDTDSYELKSESITELKKVLKFLMDNPKVKIDITGHTDNVGGSDYNKRLSLNRAKSVASYLFNKGIDTNRVNVAGKGSNEPIAPNDTESNRQLNRRIEFKVAYF